MPLSNAERQSRWRARQRGERFAIDEGMKTYVIRRGDTGPFKIGRSKNPALRIKRIQIGSAEKLLLVDVLDFDCEGAIHRELAEFALEGEWFAANAPVLEILDRIKRGG